MRARACAFTRPDASADMLQYISMRKLACDRTCARPCEHTLALLGLETTDCAVHAQAMCDSRLSILLARYWRGLAVWTLPRLPSKFPWERKEWWASTFDSRAPTQAII